jgi:hypothetical protein
MHCFDFFKLDIFSINLLNKEYFNMKNIRIIMKHFSNFTLSVFLFLMAQFSSAAIVDGIKTAADGYTDSRVLQWYNDHHSIYNLNDNLTNQMFYAYDSGKLSMFIEVPSYAKI